MENEVKFEKDLYYNIFLRLNYYLMLCIVANLVVYVVGNFKFFLENLLLIMLKINTVLAIVEMLVSFVSIGLTFFYGFTKKQNAYFYYLIPLVLFFVFSFLAMNVFAIFNYVINGLFIS